MDQKTISLQDPLFAPAIESLESAIKALISTMMKSGDKEGKASLSIGIQMQQTDAVDPATGTLTESLTPVVKFKAKCSVSRSASIGGETADDKKVVEYEPESGTWYFRETEKAQRSIF